MNRKFVEAAVVASVDEWWNEMMKKDEVKAEVRV